MGAITYRRGGRRPVMDRIDGKPMFIKKIYKAGASRVITLPVEWFGAVKAIEGKEPTKIGIEMNGKVLIIKPYFGKVLDRMKGV